jgi:peroxiredoxin
MIILMPSLVYSQQKLIIKGIAPILKNGTSITLYAYYPKRILNESPVSTTKVNNHSFRFSLKVTGAGLYYLKSPSAESKLMFLNAKETKITIADSAFNIIKVDKNETAKEFDNYNEKIKSITLFSDYSRARRDYDLYTHQKKMDSVLAQKKMSKRDSILIALQDQEIITSLEWIKQHSTSLINSYVLFDQISYMPESDTKKYFNAMSSSIKNNVWGKEIKYNIDSLFIGGTAPSFSQTDTTGNSIKLMNFRGKYVLLDFWASWCIPCRGESANLVNAYTKYKSKNFTILSISIDKNKAAWIKAIKQDYLNWTHVSDINNIVSKQYYLSTIPSNYLLDPTGKIIAKDVYSTELDKMLDKLIN